MMRVELPKWAAPNQRITFRTRVTVRPTTQASASVSTVLNEGPQRGPSVICHQSGESESPADRVHGEKKPRLSLEMVTAITKVQG